MRSTATCRRLEGKQRSGIPVDVRRKITDLILEAKKTLKIDIRSPVWLVSVYVRWSKGLCVGSRVLATRCGTDRLRGVCSELELPYIPKQVLDCIFINTLIADRNLLDEVDPGIGRMGQVCCPKA